MRHDTRTGRFASLCIFTALAASACGDIPTSGSDPESSYDSKASPIYTETCTASSPIVINSGQGFSGSSLCFNDNSPNGFIDLGTAGFSTQSIFASQGVYMWDINDTLVLTHCPGTTYVNNVYSGLPIRYLQTATTRTGRCHF